MRAAEFFVPPPADNFAIFDNDRPNRRIRLNITKTATRELQR
jgi:hypothetical protein